MKVPAAIDESALLGDLRTLVQSARQRIATAAYSTQTLLCWHIGRRLDREHLQSGRAAYGKQILVTVSRKLTAEYGRGFRVCHQSLSFKRSVWIAATGEARWDADTH